MAYFFEALFLAAALCADGFTAAFVYGSDGVKIPVISTVIITGLSAAFLALSLLAGTFLGLWIPQTPALFISGGLLIVMGILKLAAAPTREMARQANQSGPEILSAREAAVLGAALSLDSAAAGIGAGIEGESALLLFVLSLLLGFLSITAGSALGKRAASLFQADFSKLSGIVLLLLGLLKFV